MIVHVILALAMSGATWILGWWGVAIVAAILAWLLRSRRGIAWKLALAAAEGWAILLALDAATGPLSATVSTLGGVLQLPGAALIVVTILFPALIALSSAVLVTNMATFHDNPKRQSYADSF